MLSGDIELNPGPHLENLIEYSSYIKNRGTSHWPLFFLINFQSLKNKFDEFANFLQTASINTIVAETWLDTDCNIEKLHSDWKNYLLTFLIAQTNVLVSIFLIS